MYGQRTIDQELQEYTAINQPGIAYSGHVIRSHRRKRKSSHEGRQWIAVAGIGLAAIMLTTGITSSQAISNSVAARVQPAVKAATEWQAVEPAFPPIGAQGASDDALRASRAVQRKAVPPASRIEAVIRYALAQQGDPYRWANAGPNAFDCSGLVKAAFAQAGVRLPHYTGSIIKLGTRVTRAQLQRGDVVFPETHHVGIYLGNNQLIHASSSKGRVVVSKLYTFYAARRITV